MRLLIWSIPDGGDANDGGVDQDTAVYRYSDAWIGAEVYVDIATD